VGIFTVSVQYTNDEGNDTLLPGENAPKLFATGIPRRSP
jgi:hypothetical protein